MTTSPAGTRVPLPTLDCTPLLSGAPIDDATAARLAAVLRVLYEAQLVDRQRRGNWVYYRTLPGVLDDLRAALGGTETQQRIVASASATCSDGGNCG